MRETLIAVAGPWEAEPFLLSMAKEVGSGIAKMGATVLCGGRGGVMRAACEGARESGGRSIGILPGADDSDANEFLDVAICTNLGHARNTLIAQSCLALVAVGGGYGTLSEIALALKMGKPVICIGSWDIPGVHQVETPEAAVDAISQVMASTVI
jgi:uncharacterized protein (TIGR00725 family)